MISHTSNAPQVFFIDSNAASYESLWADLKDNGYLVDSCQSGKAALRLSLKTTPDLWVVSMNLPDITGPELVSMLRWRYPKSKICLVSDEYRASEEIDARCSGPELYFSKPVDSRWLLDAIDEMTAVS